MALSCEGWAAASKTTLAGSPVSTRVLWSGAGGGGSSLGAQLGDGPRPALTSQASAAPPPPPTELSGPGGGVQSQGGCAAVCRTLPQKHLLSVPSQREDSWAGAAQETPEGPEGSQLSPSFP